jgi:hypothetical protein
MQRDVIMGTEIDTRQLKRALRQWGWLTVCCLSSTGLLVSCSGGKVEDQSSDESDDNDNSNDESDDTNDGTDDSDVNGGDGGTGIDPIDIVSEDGCYSNREFLATEAWKGVVESKCLSCHGPGGIAEAQAAKFTIKPSAYPGFLDANLTELEHLAKTSFDGQSVLLRKPLGELEHGGGAVITADSKEYAVLEDLVARVNKGDSCADSTDVAHFNDVELLSPRLTWRKVTLNLAGRLPSAAEYDQLDAEGEAALPALLATLMTEQAFYDRLVEMFNDQWLTDSYLRNSNGVLNGEDFPALSTYYEGMEDAQRQAAVRSLAREPLQLMAYIVRNDRPFTEIVTADYTVLNSYTAPIYNNTDVGFTGYEYNEIDYKPGKIYISTEAGLVPLPHAGILTSPIFLNRYPTSRTNLNRHRASTVLRELLATDILKVADRPIDPTLAVHLANPTREEASCKMCHVTIDPIAGAFQKFDDNDFERYRPDRQWPTEMFLPGFGDEQMQVGDYPNALQWLGQRIATDERFPLAVVRNMYERIIGQAPIDFPEDPAGGAYVAWAAQDQTIRAIAHEFVAANFNLKTVITGLVMSPYFRAVQSTSASPERLAQLAQLGTGRLLTPEQLDRKLAATLGYQWRDGNGLMLSNTLNILYGGIDSQSVTERLETPNGLMSAVMWRMANEVSCAAVPMDFAKAPQERALFRDVTTATVPENALGEVDEAGKEAITSNIRFLYSRLFGETPATDSAEFQRAFDIYVSTWKVGRNELAFEEGDRYLPWECRYRRAPGAAEDLPEEQRLEMDETYAIRSWMAVTTYLLSDYRFLYD